MAMHSELWFPNVIWSAIIHCVDNNALKTWAYNRKRNDIGRSVSNYAGYQSSDIIKKQSPEIDILVDYVDREIDNCRKQVGLPPCELQNIWLNINPPGAYNKLHNHQGAVFSGVYFVDASSYQGNLEFERSDGAEYYLPEVPDKLTYYTATKTTYVAKTNGLYIFPSWLKHSVQGNQAKTDRISISFNYSIIS